MIIPATDAAGSVRGVQLVAVHDDGTPGHDEAGNMLNPPWLRTTSGWISGAVC